MWKWKKAEKMPNESCCRCLFLFTRDDGYSNYTVTDTELHCAMKRNPNLAAYMPDDYGARAWVGVDGDPAKDKWFATNQSRCELYQEQKPEFARVHLDVEMEDLPGPEKAMGAFMQGDVMPMLVRKYYDEN